MKNILKVLSLMLVCLTIISIIGCKDTAKPDNKIDLGTTESTIGTEEDETVEEAIAKVITKNKNAEVTSPTPYEKISNPVTVKGKANFFEANVIIRITDNDGQVLASTYTLAEGTMKLYPFSKEIAYKKPSSKGGIIEVFEESAKDGTEINKITIPVEFADIK